MIEINKIYNEDCLIGMAKIPDGSVDMILCDLPYGTTNCHWDTIIPFEPLWEHYKRVIKPNGAIVLTASQPFTSMLVMSNIKMFKYEWIWEKNHFTNFLNCSKMVGKSHENILIFSMGNLIYKPQMEKGNPYIQKRGKRQPCAVVRQPINESVTINTSGDRYPKSIIKIDSEHGKHPTQKPVALFEYLIRTYTNDGETVLDNCMGSGTTAIACIRSGRQFIGFETDKQYYEASLKRIENELSKQRLNFGE